MKTVKGKEKQRLQRKGKRKQLRKGAAAQGREPTIELIVTKEEADEICKR